MEESNINVIQLALWSTIVSLFIISLLVVLHSIQIHVLRKTAKKPFYEKILTSLTLCNLIGGILMLVTLPFVLIVKNEFHIVLYWNGFGFGLSYWTLNVLVHLVIISLDRLWATTSPFNHRIHTSKRKLIVSVALCWFVPLVITGTHIIFVVTKKMAAMEVYVYMRSTMFGIDAKIVIFADVILIVSYSAIIWILYRKSKGVSEGSHIIQVKYRKALLLCMSIVIIFMVFTTPFVAVNIRVWNRPPWLIKVSIFLFPLNQISSSIIYLVQKRRNLRASNASKSNSQCRVAIEDTGV